jgi:hypothetical protein
VVEQTRARQQAVMPLRGTNSYENGLDGLGC